MDRQLFRLRLAPLGMLGLSFLLALPVLCAGGYPPEVVTTAVMVACIPVFGLFFLLHHHHVRAVQKAGYTVYNPGSWAMCFIVGPVVGFITASHILHTLATGSQSLWVALALLPVAFLAIYVFGRILALDSDIYTPEEARQRDLESGQVI